MPFQAVVKSSEIQPGQGKCVVLGGQKIAVFNVAGRFMAVDDTCTHDEASLSEGTVIEEEGGRCVVECPWHGAHFDLCSGKALTFPAVRPVKSYPVRIAGDMIEVEVQ